MVKGQVEDDLELFSFLNLAKSVETCSRLDREDFVGGGKGSVLIKCLLSKPYLHILCHASNYRGACLYQHITSLIRAFWFSSKNGERKEDGMGLVGLDDDAEVYGRLGI